MILKPIARLPDFTVRETNEGALQSSLHSTSEIEHINGKLSGLKASMVLPREGGRPEFFMERRPELHERTCQYDAFWVEHEPDVGEAETQVLDSRTQSSLRLRRSGKNILEETFKPLRRERHAWLIPPPGRY